MIKLYISKDENESWDFQYFFSPTNYSSNTGTNTTTKISVEN